MMKMYDAGKIIIGIIIGVGLLTFPFWYNMGKAASPPEPKLTEKAREAKQCVEATPYMRSSHMQLLNSWRDMVVRQEKREYIAATGREYNMSLQNTCVDCHSNKTQFCDQCHNYMGIAPFCWDCHIAPKENK
jgi:hypothetical protein